MTSVAALPDGITLRRAEPDDLEALVRLQLAMALELAPGLPPERVADFARRLREHHARPDHPGDGAGPGAERAFLAGPADAASIATATLRIVHLAPYPRSRLVGECQVTDVYTEPAWRGRGIGRALVEACIDDARALGLRRVWLRTSAAGRGVYENLGFADPGYVLQLDLG